MFFCVPILCGVSNFDAQYTPKNKKSASGLPPLQPQDYQGLFCPNCHNNSVAPIKRREFFNIWFVPIVPVYWGKQLRCHICNWRQDFKSEDQLRKVINEQKNVQYYRPA